MKKSDGELDWELGKLSVALKISEEDVVEYFTDGRRVSFILERRLAKEKLNGVIAKSEGASYDIIAKNGGKWEVRSISKDVYFCPSYMVGSGRIFEEDGFLEKLKNIEGYILSDIKKFPKIPYWIIKSSIVLKWYNSGKLGTTTKVTRKKVFGLINEL